MKKSALYLIVSLIFTAQSWAATLYVDVNNSTPTTPYNSWATAATTIQDAVDAASTGDTVLVKDGIYKTGGNVTPGYSTTNRVCITKSIIVQSVNGPEFTTIQGAAGTNGGNDADSVRGVFMTNDCSLIGFTIENGYTRNTGNSYFDQSGGGVWLTEDCVVSNCLFTRNVAAHYEYAPGNGGGAFLYAGGTVTDCLIKNNEANYGAGGATFLSGGHFKNCDFEENSAGNGGGGVNLIFGGVLTNCTLVGNSVKSSYGEGGGARLHTDSSHVGGSLNHCLIANNSAYRAGGATCTKGTAFNDCIISNNVATSAGGVFFSYGGIMNRCLVIKNISTREQSGGVYLNNGGELNSCRITDNTTVQSSGGGVYCDGGGTINNCIVDHNYAKRSGGGIRLHHGTTVNNCVITENRANNSGAGVEAYSGDVYIRNSIVWNNKTGNTIDDFHGSNVTIHKEYTCASSDITPGTDGCITNNPVFANVANGNFNILANSPCIDAGTNSYAPTGLDFAGNPRIINSTVDMGAYETPALPSYSISVSGGANGTITPEAASVFQGYNQTFLIQPIAGYRVETLTIDGSSVSPSKTYTFTNVQATHTIAVTFGVNADTLYVDASRPDDSGDGATWATALKTIQAAVDEVAAGGTVIVTNGLYNIGHTPTPNHTAWNRICIMRNITVKSVNGPNVTIIEGDRGTLRDHSFDSIRGVYMHSGSSLFGFTIRNSFTQDNFDNREDQQGGGAYVKSSSCSISNCIFSTNHSKGKGGAIYFNSGGTLNDSSFLSNESEEKGGGIYFQSVGTVNRCLFVKNNSDGGGGAVYFENGGNLNNSTLTENRTKTSGGGGLSGGIATSCSFTGNHADYGGGISDGTANNCTFLFNTASSGGGIEYGTARNCILWYNTAEDDGNNFYDMQTPNQFCCSPDVVHGSNGNITNAPLMVSTSHIATNSPCIGAGSSTYSSGTDLDGESWNNPPTIGCDEITGTVTGSIQLALSGSTKVNQEHKTTYKIKVVGPVIYSTLNFGDGTIATNVMISTNHTWSSPGTYPLTLTGYNDEFPTGVSTTLTVQVLSTASASIYVASTGDNHNDGKSWSTAKKSIQAGVDVQEITGGIVWVTNGTYLLSKDIRIGKEICVKSVNGPDSTIVNGDGKVRCFSLENSKCLVSGFTITNGMVNGTMPDGGYETQAGGIECSGLNPVVSNCVVVGNWAKSNGGGMYKGTATHCIFSNNTAGGEYSYGGGMCRGTAENCLFIGNYSTKIGGGACWSTVRNCTIVNNTAGQSGGGISITPAYNSIIWGNTAGSNPNIYGSEVAINLCAPDGITDGVDGCITNNPLFTNPTANNFQLQETSPCINAGNNLYAPSGKDLINSPRIIAGTVDMGAYEYNNLVSFTITTTVGGNGTVTPLNPEIIQGETQTFSIQPNYGYQIDSLIIDGIAVQPTNTYTFSNVQTNHTLETLFSKIIVYVNPTRPDDSGDGQTWATAKRTLQAAVDCIDAGGTVLATNGIYAEGGSLNNRLQISKPITVRSVNGPEVTHIKGAPGSNGGLDSDALRGVLITQGKLEGFTITNGYTQASGNLDTDQSGGGIWITSNAVVSKCVLRNNAAVQGGGVYLQAGGTLNNCFFINNSATTDAAGAYLKNAGTLNNCTLVHNTSGHSYGSAAYLYYGGTLNNCIAWNNNGNDLLNLAESGTIRNTCAEAGIQHGVNGCITNAPLFIDPANEDFQLAAQSPAINAGNNLYATKSTDLANNPRIQESVVDMGALENQIPRFKITTTTSGEGTISPESPYTFQGTDQTLIIQPALGYYIQVLQVDGSSVSISTNYTFNNIQSAHTLTATFATDPHTLTVIGGSGDGSYIIGTPITLIADTPAPRYRFYEWIVDPSSYTDHFTNRYTSTTQFTMVESNVTITAHFVLAETFADASRPDNSGDGTSWSTAKKTIQAAIDTVGPNGTVWVTNGTYSSGFSITPNHILTNRISITRGITVRSIHGANATRIDGASTMRCVYMDHNTQLIGFTLRNGNTLEYTGVEDAYFDRSGGGIFLQSGATASSCKLINNIADFQGGGAKLHQGGTLNNSLSINNQATYGGGVHNKNGTLNNCTIVKNSAIYGGGIYLDAGTLNNTIIWENTAGSANNLLSTGVSTIQNSCSSETLSDGVNGCIKGNPLLATNYHLQITSPCIDAGNNSYLTTSEDLDGISIPLDGNADNLVVIDMGCFEYTSSSSDTDGDSQTDQDEAIAGTDPLNPSDYFKITTIQTTPSTFTVYFNSLSDREYQLFASTNLLNSSWLPVSGAEQRLGIGGADSMSDTNLTFTTRFYRLEVSKP